MGRHGFMSPLIPLSPAIPTSPFCWARLSIGASALGLAASSGEDRPDQVAGDVRQTLGATVVEVGELGVIQAQQVEDRGVDVVDVRLVLDRAQADLVRAAVA